MFQVFGEEVLALKKIFLLITFLIVAAFTVSCSSAEESFEADFPSDRAAKIDFGGDDLVLGFISGNFFYDEGSTFYDSMLDRLNEIGNTYNCNIRQISPSDESIIGSFYGGTRYVDIIFSDPLPTAVAGVLYPLDKLDIDLTDFATYGTPNLLEYAMWEGTPYAIIPARWPLSFKGNSGTFMIINENIIEKNGFVDPREHCENGEWTTENVSGLIPMYFVSAGDDTVYSIGANGGNLARAVLGAFGIPCVVDSDGVISSGYSLPQAEQCIDWFNRFVNEYKPYITTKNADWGSFDYINGNNAAMTLSAFDYFKEITVNVDNFGMISFPSSPYVDYGKNLLYYYFSFMLSVSGGVEDPDSICACLKSLVQPFAGYETEEDYLRYLTDNIFFDRRDAEYYVNLSRTSTYVYFNYKLDNFTEMSNEFGSGSGASFLSRKLDQLNEYSQITAANREYVRFLYGSQK